MKYNTITLYFWHGIRATALILWCAALKQSCLLRCPLQPFLWAALLPSPRLQYIKDHCLAATTTSASPIRPQIASLESSLSDLPFYKISSSSNLPRASTRHQNSQRHLHTPPRAATHLLYQSRTATRYHAPDLFVNVIILPAYVSPNWCHLLTLAPHHPLTYSPVSLLMSSVDFDQVDHWLLTFYQSWLFAVQVLLTQFFA